MREILKNDDSATKFKYLNHNHIMPAQKRTCKFRRKKSLTYEQSVLDEVSHQYLD